MKNIFFIILFCFLSNNLNAETISTVTTQTSAKTITEDQEAHSLDFAFKSFF